MGFEQARQRLEGCLSQTTDRPKYAELTALKEQALALESELHSKRPPDSELTRSGVELIYTIEKATSAACGEARGAGSGASPDWPEAQRCATMSTSDLPFIQRLRLRENHIFLALTIIIGVLAGLAAVLFTLAIKGTTYLLFGIAPSYLRYILVPTLMSLVTGFLLVKFFPDARGSGVPQTEAAYHLNQGNIPFRVAFGKFLTGALCIGSGHSMGREGPSVQIGAGIGSSIGKMVSSIACPLAKPGAGRGGGSPVGSV